MAQTDNDEVLAVQNVSDVAQHIYWEERRETIYPKQVRQLPAALAREFLATRARFCVLYRPIQMPSMDGAANVYLANGSGNPWLPKTIKIERKYRGEIIEEDKPHPLRAPFVIRETIARGQSVQPAREGDGDESINHPPMVVEIPPFERLLVPVPIAEILVERDDRRTDGWRGQIIQARAPGEFEPNETWPYEEIRLYAALLAPDLYAEHLQAHKGEPALFPAEASFGGNKAAIREVRKRLLDMLFFQLIDERYPFPDRREFTKKLEQLTAEAKQRTASPSARA